MPNWVTNRVSFKGSEKRINKLLEAIKSDEEEEHIDFNKLIPMPVVLHDTTSDRASEIAKNVAKILEKEPLNEILEDRLEDVIINALPPTWLPEKELIERIKQHIAAYKECGYTDWYQWSCDQWGTKWNASDSSLIGEQLSFKTAWSTPQPVMGQLSKMFPDVEIKVEYADEDVGSNCGSYAFLKGVCSGRYNPSGIAATHFARDVLGIEEEEETE
jgi:hypothetical protein